MQKLLPVFIIASALSGCATDPQPAADWTKNGGCEKYFSETSRELANCKAFVEANETKEKTASVSLDKKGTEIESLRGKRAETSEKTLEN